MAKSGEHFIRHCIYWSRRVDNEVIEINHAIIVGYITFYEFTLCIHIVLTIDAASGSSIEALRLLPFNDFASSINDTMHLIFGLVSAAFITINELNGRNQRIIATCMALQTSPSSTTKKQRNKLTSLNIVLGAFGALVAVRAIEALISVIVYANGGCSAYSLSNMFQVLKASVEQSVFFRLQIVFHGKVGMAITIILHAHANLTFFVVLFGYILALFMLLDRINDLERRLDKFALNESTPMIDHYDEYRQLVLD